MRYAALLLLAVPAAAQIANRPAASVPKSPVVANRGPYAKIPLKSIIGMEREFDSRLSLLGADREPIEALGLTRGLYLDGYGIVFTTELGLVALPTIGSFRTSISDAMKSKIHSTKVTRLPALRETIRKMMGSIATDLGQIPENQQVVIAVRLAYAPWENTAGLPVQIIGKADRRAAMTGNFQLEEQ
jgi:hypothetical protein